MADHVLFTVLLPALTGLGLAWLLWHRLRPARAAVRPAAPGAAFPTLAGIRHLADQVRTAEARRQHVRQTGQPVEATVLTVAETGVAQHDHDEDADEPLHPLDTRPQVRLWLRIVPPQGSPFEVEINEFVTRPVLARLQPGQAVAVRYLPGEPNGVALAE